LRFGTRRCAVFASEAQHDEIVSITQEGAMGTEEKGMAEKSSAKLARISSRRGFVKEIVWGGAAALAALRARPVFAEGAVADAAPRTPEILSGKNFELTIDEIPVNYTGRRRMATAVNGSVPGPTLRWREGDAISIAVTNRMKISSSIHWHGVRLPAGMDGVPGLSYPGIAPGETFTYRFPVLQSGTYWYHSHTRFQEQTGLYGAIIIDRDSKDPVEFDREYVVLLSDWTDANPETVFSNLKEDSEFYNYHRRTVGTFFSDVKKRGLGKTISDRLMWARMNMSPTDFADVTGATYTYLMNGNSPRANWTALFQPGERIRLRFINGSSMTFFDVRIPGLPLTVVQADGNDVEPVTVDEFRMGVAEVYDVTVQPKDAAAYTIFAQSMDRSGYARGTLAPHPGMAADVPPMDPPPLRTMIDMGMGKMAGMNMAGIDGMTHDDMAGMSMGTAPQSPEKAADNESNAMPGMNMGGDHNSPASNEKSGGKKMESMPEMKMGNPDGTIPFPQPGPGVMAVMSPSEAKAQMRETKLAISKPPRLHIGPQIDMLPQNVTERLNNPGDGLRHNGRRVLTYADLRARYEGADGRPPTREIELHLTGNMQRYVWSFNGRPFSGSEPVRLKLGERVRIVLINDTMMEHPIHLHGLWSELENGHGARNPYKHTVIVKPSERVSYLVSADTPGQWAFHCHLLYHMQAGMFRTVVVS
jgi:CopA family copper-resistance protein